MNEKSDTAKKGFLKEFKNGKSGTRLLVGFVLIVILMVTIVTVSLQSPSQVREDAAKFDVPASVTLQQVEADILEDTRNRSIISYFVKLERRRILLRNLEKWRRWKNVIEAHRRRLQHRWLH